ncbi:MAG: hypothetical protein KF882_01330 [Bacteroidia bacterium]|nr:hypothetical protein [Bacteroidia bacterium]MCO5253268.1 hypothetical protein [Bacteroidota bacterium]
MKKSFIIVAVLLFVLSSCKDKDPKIKKTYELSPEMKAYFVDYAVGTKWIYQDTLDENNFDTIELVSKNEYNQIVNGTTVYKRYILYYVPKKSKDFQVQSGVGAYNIDYVKVYPMEAGVGAVAFENDNGRWTTGVTYYDSIEIKGTMFYKVIISKSASFYHLDVSISQNVGIVGFWNTSGPGVLENYYKLIKTIKP